MTTILLTLGTAGTQVVNSPLSRAELHDVLGLLSNDFEIIWASDQPDSSLRLIDLRHDTAVNEYLLSIIMANPTPNSPLPEPIPVDPRSMSVINLEGTGIQGLQTNDGLWHYSAHLKHERIYEFDATTQEDVIANLEKIRAAVDVLEMLANFSDSTCNLFPASSPETVETPESDATVLPDLTTPINKKDARDRLEGLLGTGHPEPAPAVIPGTFLMLKEGTTKPMQVILRGDGEVLRDIGFLALLDKKYERDIQVSPETGKIRTVKIKRHLAKRYLEVVRSILLDCSLVQNYEIVTDEYIPNNALYADHIFL